MKNIRKIWSASMILSGICTLIVSTARLFDIELSKTAKRVLGAAMLVNMPVMVYTSVKVSEK
ncbi:MAG: hypothetical protein IJ779_10000 [Ruminococcus sp.]|nr:hypothetical protein [Ruminococcus sp.]